MYRQTPITSPKSSIELQKNPEFDELCAHFCEHLTYVCVCVCVLHFFFFFFFLFLPSDCSLHNVIKHSIWKQHINIYLRLECPYSWWPIKCLCEGCINRRTRNTIQPSQFPWCWPVEFLLSRQLISLSFNPNLYGQPILIS